MATGALRTQDLRVVLNYILMQCKRCRRQLASSGEIFEMASKNELTTDTIIKMGEELGKLKAPPPDSFRVLQAELSNLSGELGTAIVPLIAPLVSGLNSMVQAFNKLPQPVKQVAGAFLLFAGAFVIITPLLAGFVGALAAIGPAFIAIGGAITGVMGLLSGLGPAIGGIIAILRGPWVGSQPWLLLVLRCGCLGMRSALRSMQLQRSTRLGSTSSRAYLLTLSSSYIKALSKHFRTLGQRLLMH